MGAGESCKELFPDMDSTGSTVSVAWDKAQRKPIITLTNYELPHHAYLMSAQYPQRCIASAIRSSDTVILYPSTYLKDTFEKKFGESAIHQAESLSNEMRREHNVSKLSF